MTQLVHNFNRNEVLCKIVPPVKYYYNIPTNRQLLDKVGYSSPTYLSDTMKGKVAVSDKFIARLAEVFLVNPDVFDGKSCDIFLPQAGFKVTLDPLSGDVMQDTKNVHVHIGDTKSDQGDVYEHIQAATIAKDAASLEKMTEMHKDSVAALTRAIDLNHETLIQLTKQNEELRKSLFEEMRAQRELFYNMMNVRKDDSTK